MSRDERGSGTVVAITFLGVLLLVGAALGVVAAMVWSHRVAQSAADLAALAAATELREGSDACATAGQLSADNGAALVSCSVRGDEVVVEVKVPGPGWLGQKGDLSARARAGPG